jgi:hypothetical protein
MPLDGSIGYGQWTAWKQEHYRRIIRRHIAIIDLRGPIHHFDLTAGWGFQEGPDGLIPGSVVTFLDEARKARHPYSAWFFEKDYLTFRRLKETVDERESSHGETFCISGDYREELIPRLRKLRIDMWPKEPYGLIYVDHSGDLPDFDVLSVANAVAPRLDLLMYLPATNIKRIAKSPDCEETRRLQEALFAIGKRRWLIREAQGAHQWTLLLGTNWVGYREDPSIALFAMDSPRGMNTAQRLHYTIQELRSMEEIGQLRLKLDRRHR